MRYLNFLIGLLITFSYNYSQAQNTETKPRIIVTSDGEIDDQCSMVRFMLYTNECDVEGIISSSSQYHAHDDHWAGDDWIEPDLAAYTAVYPNLIKHDPNYPSPEYLKERIVLGNVKTEGDMAEPTEGSDLIVKVLLDRSDDRPVWLQAWGGTNTIARALKTIEEKHPDRMAEVASKCKIFGIWEQDATYQEYIRPVWGKYEILTIVSDQFEALAYRWKQAQPEHMHPYLEGPWMRENILENHGPLCSIYASHINGDFRSEGDSPAFLHTIVNGLRNMESPDWGGWGGRYVRVRENTWLDPVPVPGYTYPKGRWYGSTGWGRNSIRDWSTATHEQRMEYFKPMWRWTDDMQNDFAARADWCVKSYEEANHPPVIQLAHGIDLNAKPGETVQLNAKGTKDPDNDVLNFNWWQYEEADSYEGVVAIQNAKQSAASFTIPEDANHGETIHIICEVTDAGSPPITRYQRIVIKVEDPIQTPKVRLNGNGVVEIPPMVAHFPLDGKDGSMVKDIVSGQQGELINADSEVSWVSGSIDNAIHLDGYNDRIIIPHNDAFDFGDESFSITFWMRWPEGLPPGHEHILTKGDYESFIPGETGKRYELYISGGNLRFNIDDDAAKSQIQVSLKPFITGEWVHIAAVCDKSDNRLRLYANGLLQAPNNPGNSANDGRERSGSIKNTRPLYIGDATREDNPFHGDLDDLRFFRAALNHNQVAAIATKAKLEEKEPSADSKMEVKMATADEMPTMSAHFPMDEGKGVTIHEAISGSNTPVQNGNQDEIWTTSDVGMALELDGENQSILVPNSSGFDFEDESFSVAFHMRWPNEGLPKHEYILCKGDYDTDVNGETGKRWEIDLTHEGLGFIVDDNVNKTQLRVSYERILRGHWVHVVAVRDKDANELRLYINGEQHESIDPTNIKYNGEDRTRSISNPKGLSIGTNSRGVNHFNGEISDLRIYRTALNPSQVLGSRRLKKRASANPQGGYAGAKTSTTNSGKPRLLVLTDIGDDPDDEQSMVRLLLYANHFDIVGVVTELWWEETHSGRHGAINPESQMELMHHAIDLYEEVLPNLDQHAKGYPRPEELHKVVKRGKADIKMTLSTEKGDPLQWIGLGEDTEGSDYIIEVVDRDDPRPVDIAVWGGPADLAQALMKVREERTPEELEKFLSKIRVHAISDQDDTGPWIRENFPSLFYILDHDPNGDKWESCYRGMFYGGDESLTSRAWIDEHVRFNHGPLGAFYPPETSTNKNPHGALKEGDTPSWFYFYPNGLQVPERPDYGGWGGRYKKNGTFWQDAYDRVGNDFNGRASVYRFRPQFQNDFKARLDWCVKSYDEANHSPVISLAHEINLKAKAGDEVILNAEKSSDPDGDKLNYKWWNYVEAGTLSKALNIKGSTKEKACFKIPKAAKTGDTIHVICELTDNGMPALTSYQRVVIEVE